MKNPLGQVKLVRLFKVAVLNLHVIMMKPEISDFILSDHKTRGKSLQQFQLSLQSLRTVIFPALSLPSRKFQSVVNTNLAKRLASYFAVWCASPP